MRQIARERAGQRRRERDREGQTGRERHRKIESDRERQREGERPRLEKWKSEEEWEGGSVTDTDRRVIEMDRDLKSVR